MQVTVTFASSDVVCPLEVSPDMELENFKVLVQIEGGVTDIGVDMVFLHNGKILLGENKSLAEHGILNNDVLLFGPAPQNTIQNVSHPPRLGQPVSSAQRNTAAISGIDWSSIQIPSAATNRPTQRNDSEDPEAIRQMFLNDPHQLSLLKERNPRMSDVIHNPEQFKKLLLEQRKERMEQERQRIRLLTADPFDPEVQRQIAEEIRMENVNQNMHTAMEYNPEAFAEVYMLYINCRVNGHDVKAFVDSGAQMTIMSKACAERCGITRLIDTRWQGMAVGVGQQKILGRVHLGQMQIETNFLSTSFTILENQPMDILLGLDMLKRHQCCIDLNKNVLLIGTTGTETRFLNESELPECARLNRKRALTNNADSQEDEDRLLAEALEKSANETI